MPRFNAFMSNVAVGALALPLIALLATTPADAETLEPRTAVLWQPYVQWELTHEDVEGNPYDVQATATFTHQDSGETRTTGLFYAGGDTWAFRFAGTRTGTWSFQTEGPGNLGGHRGQVTVEPNPNPAASGFIGAERGRFVRQGPGEGEREAFIPNVWMNYRRWGHPASAGWTDIRSTFGSAATVQAYLDDAQAHGCNAVHALIANSWFAKDVADASDHASENPDPATFEALERAILQAHARGMFVHIWAWGDQARGWTPVDVGGINGEADRRLQRYLAARLGPLPGWTMQYGFDLNEWVEPEQVRAWAAHLEDHLGWDHLLGARETHESDGFVSPMDLPYLAHDARPTDDFRARGIGLLKHADGRPVLLEHRFSWRRGGVWDMPTTQRAMWQFAMAGGIGAIWGHYPPGSTPYESGHYDAPVMRTHRDFWRRRFGLNLRPADELAEGGWVLREGDDRYIFYQEETGAVSIDLSGMDGPQPAVAVDTSQPYAEIDLGTLEPGEHTLELDRASDWAIAVGEFE